MLNLFYVPSGRSFLCPSKIFLFYWENSIFFISLLKRRFNVKRELEQTLRIFKQTIISKRWVSCLEWMIAEWRFQMKVDGFVTSAGGDQIFMKCLSTNTLVQWTLTSVMLLSYKTVGSNSHFIKQLMDVWKASYPCLMLNRHTSNFQSTFDVHTQWYGMRR